MKSKRLWRYLLSAFIFSLVISVGALFAPTAKTARAASVSATEWGHHDNGIGKVIFGTWNNYNPASGNPQGYSQQLEVNPQIENYLLLDGKTFAVFEAENPNVNLSVNRFMNGIYVMILSGVLPEFTVFTLKEGCPLPYAGDTTAIQLSGDTVDKDYNLVWANGSWDKASSDFIISTFGALSEPIAGETYTDVSFVIPFNNQIIDTPTDNLTGTANTNARNSLYFNGTKLSNLSTATPAAGNVSVPKIGASGRFLTITFRMTNDSFDISAIERKQFRIASGLRLPNYSGGFLGFNATGVYNGSDVVRYYIDEAKCWIRSAVDKAEIEFSEENQLFLEPNDVNNLKPTFDGVWYRIPVVFKGDNSVLPAGSDPQAKYNQHYAQLYGAGERTEQSIDRAIGGGYYTSLLENVKVNGVKLSDTSIFETNHFRVDYYSNYIMIITDPTYNFSLSEITITLGGGLFFPSGKNMNGREVNLIFKPGQDGKTDIAVSAVAAENGYDTPEESKQHPIGIALNQTIKINASTVPYDAAIKYLIYEIVESSQNETVKITKKGVLTAKKTGSITVKISALGGEDPDAVKYVSYSISELPLSRIALEKEAETVLVGGTIDLQVYYSPSNASFKELGYTSSNESVAKVENGRVIGLKGGTAVILGVVCFELLINSIYCVFRQHEDVTYSTRESYLSFTYRWS
ncbi:MAG: Ig-like domain-containing protein, partial [Clostridia bacterium]|nr:Ig-like domain-containing protein [Clostridia bacterium]